jgi:predicted transcriptional regulator
MTAFTVQSDAETVRKLDKLQAAEISAGLMEANQGDFASDDEVRAVLGKYEKPEFSSPAGQ